MPMRKRAVGRVVFCYWLLPAHTSPLICSRLQPAVCSSYHVTCRTAMPLPTGAPASPQAPTAASGPRYSPLPESPGLTLLLATKLWWGCGSWQFSVVADNWPCRVRAAPTREGTTVCMGLASVTACLGQEVPETTGQVDGPEGEAAVGSKGGGEARCPTCGHCTTTRSVASTKHARVPEEKP